MERVVVGNTLIDIPGNTNPPVERVYAFVSRDPQGREHICGCLMGVLGMQPMVTADVGLLIRMTEEAHTLRDNMPKEYSIHLLSFTNREEIEGW